MKTFCTLFDSYYLDKGIVLYRSLEKVTDDFALYIFCFDDRSQEILTKMNLKHAVILSHKDIERDEPRLLKIKEERSKAEYCWTCTPVIVEYVLNHYDVDSCTYIDSDLYFFADPEPLFEEIRDNDCNILITPHRFPDTPKGMKTCKRSGKYCVEFNYFDKSDNAKEALTWWKERCLEWCYHIYEPERMGDQKYLEKFPVLFKGVHEMSNKGGGVAPWNFSQYRLYEGGNTESGSSNKLDCNEGDVLLKEKATGDVFPIIFYHFQNLRFLSDHVINVSSESHSKKTKDAVYPRYLRAIRECRKELKEYGVTFSVKKIYASNKLIALMQGTVLRFKIKSLSDIYNWDKL